MKRKAGWGGGLLKKQGGTSTHLDWGLEQHELLRTGEIYQRGAVGTCQLREVGASSGQIRHSVNAHVLGQLGDIHRLGRRGFKYQQVITVASVLMTWFDIEEKTIVKKEAIQTARVYGNRGA